MAQDQKEDRGPGARKTTLEKRLNANADAIEGADDNESPSAQQATSRGQKDQLAQPHHPGRTSGGKERE